VNGKGKLAFSWLSAKANKNVAQIVLLNAGSKEVITDKAPWYKAACRILGIKWKHETFGERNVVERAFMPLKKRMKEFFKRFPANSKYETVWRWIASFLTFRLAFYGYLS
jgi:putative transposase